jgi:hypothetical protein
MRGRWRSAPRLLTTAAVHALRRVGDRLEALELDAHAAADAVTEAALVHATERLVDLFEQVPGVQGERLSRLALEARRARIRRIVVEAALTPVLDVGLGVEPLDGTEELRALCVEPVAEGAELGCGERTSLSGHEAADGTSERSAATGGG